ncbi:MAG: CHAD domain-containing protein [Chloroflexota bacterium]
MTPHPGLEVEAKFDVLARPPTRALVRGSDLAGLPGIGAPRRVQQLDRYLDTPDERLRAAGWAARLRTIAAETRIQLKRTSAPGTDGVSRRTELDGPAGPDDDPASWPTSAARRRLLQLLGGEAPTTRLTLRQDRLVRDFGDEGTRVELSLDRISAVAGDATVGRLAILELELRSGDGAGFERAVAHLRVQPFLSPSSATKLGWGAALVANRTRAEALPVIGAEDLPIAGDDPTAEVGRRILRTQLRRLLERERAVLGSPGPEELRRMRVATRRLRATWRAFGPLFAGRTPDRLRRRLGRLGDELSAVRDLDVLLGRVAGDVTGPSRPDPGALAGLVAAIEERRAAALARLQAELATPRHARWLEAFVEFVETPGLGAVPARPPAPRLAREQVGGWIWAAVERLLAWEPVLAIADLPTLHLLRIEAKRLRDLVQVAAPLSVAPAATTAAIVASLVRIQDTLGAVNDAVVTAATCRAYLTERAGTLAAGEARAIERFAIAQERVAERGRRRAPAAWRAATSPAARRRLGRFIGGI